MTVGTKVGTEMGAAMACIFWLGYRLGAAIQRRRLLGRKLRLPREL